MSAARQLSRAIARFLVTIERAAEGAGLKVTTVREAGTVTVRVAHPEGPVALEATLTSPPAPRAPRPAPPGQMTLDEAAARQATARRASPARSKPATDEDESECDWPLVVGDVVKLDGVEVEVMGADAGGFIWRTTGAGERDEGDSEWSDVREVSPHVWETKEAPGDLPESPGVYRYIMVADWDRLAAEEPEVLRALVYPAAGVAVPNTRVGTATYRTLGPMPARVATHLDGASAKYRFELYAEGEVPAAGASWCTVADPMDDATMKFARIVVRSASGTRMKRREGQTDEGWLADAREMTELRGLRAARLYAKGGACVWDSRDGEPLTELPPPPPRARKGNRRDEVLQTELAPEAPATAAVPGDELAGGGSKKAPKGARGSR